MYHDQGKHPFLDLMLHANNQVWVNEIHGQVQLHDSGIACSNMHTIKIIIKFWWLNQNKVLRMQPTISARLWIVYSIGGRMSQAPMHSKTLCCNYRVVHKKQELLVLQLLTVQGTLFDHSMITHTNPEFGNLPCGFLKGLPAVQSYLHNLSCQLPTIRSPSGCSHLTV